MTALNRLHALACVSLAVLSASSLFAQEPAGGAAARVSTPAWLQLSGALRWRSELDGRNILSKEYLLPHYLRSRLRATARPGDLAAVVLEIQDSRHFGSGNASASRGTYDGSADAIDMHQAYGELDSLFGAPLRLRIGRQEIGLGNERLIGTGGWNQIGRSYDAGRATLSIADGALDGVAARLTTPSASSTAAQNLYALWLRQRFVRSLTVDAFGILDVNTTPLKATADSGKALLERVTTGLNAKLTLGSLDAELEGAAQFGHLASNDSSSRRSINAFMLSATLGFTIDTASRARGVLIATILSGDPGPDDRHESFNTLFGNGHGFYGQMDVVPDITSDRGMVDLGAQFSISPAAGLRLLIEGHHLTPQRNADVAFGQEFDLTFSWRVTRPFELSGGGGVFLPGDELETRLGSDPVTWFFVSGVWSF